MHNKSLVLGLLGAASACTASATPPSALAPTVVASPAPAANIATVSLGLETRADQLVGLLNGTRAAQDFFQPGTEEKFSAEKVGRVQAMVRDRFGSALRVTGIEVETPNVGVVSLEMEMGQMRVRLAVSDETPHGVIELAPSR